MDGMGSFSRGEIVSNKQPKTPGISKVLWLRRRSRWRMEWPRWWGARPKNGDFWCVGRRFFRFFSLVDLGIVYYCIYNVCTVYIYIYIHIHCVYWCFFGVGGRLGMNPRIDMQRSRSIIEYVFSINECTTSSVWNEQLKPKIQPDSATLSSVWTSPRWTMNT